MADYRRRAKEFVGGVLDLMIKAGHPPEMTHKSGITETSIDIDWCTWPADEDIFQDMLSQTLIEAWHSKAALVALLTAVREVQFRHSQPGDPEWAMEPNPTFDVVLSEVGERRFSVIGEIRNITGLSLVEAKYLVDAVRTEPVIGFGISETEADNIKRRLEKVGATVKVTREP